MPSLDLDLIIKILSLIVTVLIAIINRYFEAKPKLISYLVHASAIPVYDENNIQKGTINTHSIVVLNIGKKTAHNIRIGHHYLPKGFQVFPPVSHTILNNSDGSAEIVIPTLVPNEQVSISYLYLPPVTYNQVNAYTKSDEGLANIINVIPTQKPSKFVAMLIWLLVFLGMLTLVYSLFFLITHIGLFP